jgi:hypothetical protein
MPMFKVSARLVFINTESGWISKIEIPIILLNTEEAARETAMAFLAEPNCTEVRIQKK